MLYYFTLSCWKDSEIFFFKTDMVPWATKTQQPEMHRILARQLRINLNFWLNCCTIWLHGRISPLNIQISPICSDNWQKQPERYQSKLTLTSSHESKVSVGRHATISAAWRLQPLMLAPCWSSKSIVLEVLDSVVGSVPRFLANL